MVVMQHVLLFKSYTAQKKELKNDMYFYPPSSFPCRSIVTPVLLKKTTGKMQNPEKKKINYRIFWLWSNSTAAATTTFPSPEMSNPGSSIFLFRSLSSCPRNFCISSCHEIFLYKHIAQKQFIYKEKTWDLFGKRLKENYLYQLNDTLGSREMKVTSKHLNALTIFARVEITTKQK